MHISICVVCAYRCAMLQWFLLNAFSPMCFLTAEGCERFTPCPWSFLFLHTIWLNEAAKETSEASTQIFCRKVTEPHRELTLGLINTTQYSLIFPGLREGGWKGNVVKLPRALLGWTDLLSSTASCQAGRGGEEGGSLEAQPLSQVSPWQVSNHVLLQGDPWALKIRKHRPS